MTELDTYLGMLDPKTYAKTLRDRRQESIGPHLIHSQGPNGFFTRGQGDDIRRALAIEPKRGELFCVRAGVYVPEGTRPLPIPLWQSTY